MEVNKLWSESQVGWNRECAVLIFAPQKRSAMGIYCWKVECSMTMGRQDEYAEAVMVSDLGKMNSRFGRLLFAYLGLLDLTSCQISLGLLDTRARVFSSAV